MEQNRTSRFRAFAAIFLGLLSLVILLALLFQEGGTSIFSSLPKEPPVIITTGTVKPGDTLAHILSSHGQPDLFVYRIQNTFSRIFDLRTMIPGHKYEIITSTDGVFKQLNYSKDAVESYTVSRSSDGVYSTQTNKLDTVWMEKVVRGRVTENAYKNLLDQGYDETLVANLIQSLGDEIFAWRIDFFTEQRVGDEFEILFEQKYPVGSDKPLSELRVLAAYYKGSGTRQDENYAFRYQGPKAQNPDYFDRKGKAVRKAFLRAPFSHRGFRISSHFNPRRFHPILRQYRAHHGTDYACSPGTPVVSVGDGVVISAGWNGGYGNAIDIRHSNKYVSRYGHLSKILVKKGQRVSQGDLIAKSGNTGRSTGPHLHFEMHVDGNQKNFLRLNFPAADSVVAGNMDEFKQTRDQYLSRMRAQHASAKDVD